MEELNATVREATGKVSTKALRNKGQVPASLYGKGVETLSLAIDEKDLVKLVRRRHETGLITLNITGKSGVSRQDAIYQEIQATTFKRRVLHVDFHAVSADEKVELKVHVKLKGTPEGVSVGGGILMHGMVEVHVRCLPRHIPEDLVVDVSKMKIGDSLYVKDMVFEGLELTDEPMSMVAHISQPQSAGSAIPAAAAPAAAATPAAPAGGKAAPAAKAPEKKK